MFVREECPAFANLLSSIAGDASLSLSAIFYLDEVTPGDPLRPIATRKFWAFYISFAEYGKEILFREEVWLTIAVLRTEQCKVLRGGVSGACKALFRYLFVDGQPNFTAGFGIRLPGLGARLIRASLKHIVADAAALKYLFQSKGASGLKPCMECTNVWRKNHGVDQENALTVASPPPFEKRSDDYLFETYDFLETQQFEANFEVLLQAAGLNYCPGGLLADRGLRNIVKPIAQRFDDWPHVFFRRGTFQVELKLFLQRSSRFGVGWERFRNLDAAEWKSPRHTMSLSRSVGKSIFSEYREHVSHNVIKWNISECLLAYPLIRFGIDTLPPELQNELKHEIESMHALLHMVDVIIESKKTSSYKRNCRDLVTLHAKHIRLLVAAYGADACIPKHHSAYHILNQLEMFDYLPDSLTLERKHKKAKAFGDMHLNPNGYEKYILVSCMMDQRRMLLEEKLLDSMLGSDRLQWHGAIISVGDVMILKECAIVVSMLWQEDEGFYLRGQKLSLRCKQTDNATVLEPQEELIEMMLSSELIAKWPQRWSVQADGSVLVLHVA